MAKQFYPNFEPLEPIFIYPTNGGNGIYIEPVRGNDTLLIGKKNGRPINTMKELTEFLSKHFQDLGGNRAT